MNGLDIGQIRSKTKPNPAYAHDEEECTRVRPQSSYRIY